MANFGEKNCQEGENILMEQRLMECDSCSESLNPSALFDKRPPYEDTASDSSMEDPERVYEKSTTNFLTIHNEEGKDGDAWVKHPISILNTCKFVMYVSIMLIMRGMEGDFDVKMEKVSTDSNHFCGISLTFFKGGKNNSPIYFIGNKIGPGLFDCIRRLSSKITGALLKVVLDPKDAQMNKKLTEDLKVSKDDFLNVPITVRSKKIRENVVYCCFEENVPREMILDAVVKLYGKRGEKGKGEEEIGKRESEVVSRFLTSEIEGFLMNEGQETELVLKRCSLDKEIRKKLFGSVLFRKITPAPKHVGGSQNLHRLHDLLREGTNNTVVICGPVGVGKSELSARYAEVFETLYDNVVWIDSSSPEKAENSFFELARDVLRILLKGTDGKKKDARTLVDDVYHFFRNKRTLFVFDNAQDRECVLLPVSVHQCVPHVIITSRNRNWGKVTVMEVEPLREEDARELLGETAPSSCDAVAKEVEYNPWLLTKFQNEGGEEEARMSKMKEVMSYMPRLAEALSKTVDCSLHLTESDRTVFDHTLDKIKKESCWEVFEDILKELVYSKQSCLNTKNLSKDLDLTCEALNLLVDNSFAENVDGRIKIHSVVKLLLLWKWTLK